MLAGIYWGGRNAADAVDRMVAAEAAGVPVAWHGHGGPFPDPLTFLAAAAARTTRIRLGTGIVQVHNRTAAVVASQALALSQLAPGRFRLGLGFDRGLQRPLAYMREFLLAIRPSLDAAGVPLVLATIGPRSFELAGELADEAMTWLVEPHVVRDIAGPRLESAAAGAGRPVPPVILHMNVTFDPDLEQAAMTIRSSPLGRMRADGWPDSAVENLTAWGPDDQVRQQLQHALDISGAAELMLRPVFHDPQNPGDEGERFLRLVARLND